MSGVNKVIIVGNLGQDPETRHMPSGDAITNISVATSEEWTKDGEKQQKTEWHKIVFFKRLAEVASQYLSKGSKVYVEGKLQTRQYEKDGQTRYITEIIGQQLQMLDSKGGQQQQSSSPSQSRQAEKPKDDFDDDIPF